VLFLLPESRLLAADAPERAILAAAPRRLEAPLVAAVLRHTTPMLTALHAAAADIQHALASILRGVLAAASSSPPRSSSAKAVTKAVRDARALVEHRYAERPTVEQIATEVDLSPFHLERTFRDRYGVPVHAYLTKVRVARALELLRSGTRPGLIADAVGFADQAHLTRVFRKELGLTPGDVRVARGQDLRGDLRRDLRGGPRGRVADASLAGHLAGARPARG
jgi:AraC-like DNA-binding protein